MKNAKYYKIWKENSHWITLTIHLVIFFSSKDLEIWGELTDSPLDFVFCKEGVALGAPDREIQRRVTV